MTLAERSKLEATAKADRAVSRGTDGAVRRERLVETGERFAVAMGWMRDDNGRRCRNCGRVFLPVDGNKYCDDCQKGWGW
jgi:hypothetical protein